MLLKKITSSPPSESHPYILRAWLSFSPSPAVTWAIKTSLPSLWAVGAREGMREGKAAERGRKEQKGTGMAELGLGGTVGPALLGREQQDTQISACLY